ncbi:peptidase M20 domain-containing protein 2-like [Paramacrobiotus metropolitanus]|uniref:peptidase M20 domain-containing protein 2-like n=1 Tax=Paramacrobiotus metropolitanus TaxID=2943436 RepID=UPI00244630C6|nr:peptidase M20 domain-containing protein 2-like [Paramacrobiotus metropolitanus]
MSASSPTADQFESAVQQSLQAHFNDLSAISQEIWSHPETGYQEHHAVQQLTDYMEKIGYQVTRKFCDIETSFLGEYQTPGFDAAKHPTVAVLCEYDALPDIGHGCGHNLIAIVGLGAFLAAAEVLKAAGSAAQGRIVCMGAPAEELGGGKVLLLESGAFKGVDYALMSHPAPVDVLEPSILSIDHCQAEFYGKAAHASCGPWEGVNALDAVIAAYNNVSMLRQQLKPGHQIHMIIKNGGAKPNIIPEYTKAEIYIRAPTSADVDELRTRVAACMHAGAEATGCRVECGLNDLSYSGLMSNQKLLSIYKHFGEKNGMRFMILPPGAYGSTDMGNVSTTIPSIHPGFCIGDPHCTMIHTREFRDSVGKPVANHFAMKSAAALALTALELFSNPDFRKDVQTEFDQRRPVFMGKAATEGTDMTDSVDGTLQLPSGFNPDRRRSSRQFLIDMGLLKPSLLEQKRDSIQE